MVGTCRVNPLWLPYPQRRQATIRTNSRTKRNDEAINLSLQKNQESYKKAFKENPRNKKNAIKNNKE